MAQIDSSVVTLLEERHGDFAVTIATLHGAVFIQTPTHNGAFVCVEGEHAEVGGWFSVQRTAVAWCIWHDINLEELSAGLTAPLPTGG